MGSDPIDWLNLDANADVLGTILPLVAAIEVDAETAVKAVTLLLNFLEIDPEHMDL